MAGKSGEAVGAAVPTVAAGAVNGTGSSVEVLKSRIFSSVNKRLRSEKVEFFGAQIEVRQATVGETLDMRLGDDDRPMLIHVLLNYVYVPGTQEKVFSEADVDQLQSLPYGPEMEMVMSAWRKLTQVNVGEAEKN